MSDFDEEQETVEFGNLAKLAENLVYRLPGCADLMIRKTLQDVYRDFCRRSCCLRGRRQLQLGAGQIAITVSPMYGGVVDCVAEVVYNGRKLNSGRHYKTESRGVTSILLAPNLIPPDDCDESSLPVVGVTHIEIPKLTSEEVPQWVLDRYGEAICAGVIARLMSMTGRAWSDAAQAGDARIQYENAVNEERIRYYAGDTSGNGTLDFAPNAGELI